MRVRTTHNWVLAPSLLSCLLLCAILATTARGTVLTGALDQVPESVGCFSWGDGLHNLTQQWSDAMYSAGWFYGTDGACSNVDEYVYHGALDVTTVTHAEGFPYSESGNLAYVGDTVFFRGTNGYYGAWKIGSILPLTSDIPRAALNGTWYFQDNKTGCFSSACSATPTKSSTWGRLKSLYR